MSQIAFLPGWGFKRCVWNETINDLEIEDAVTIDLPDVEGDDFSRAVVELSREIEDQSTIVAWSVGGLLAIQLAYMFPKKCAKLILVGSLPKFLSIANWPGITNDFFETFIHQATNNLNKTLNKFSSLVQFPHKPNKSIKEHMLDSSSEEKLLNYLSLMQKADYRPHLKILSIPIFFIMNEKDAVIPSYSKDGLENINENITVFHLKEASHAPFINNKNIFNKVLMDLI
ncbi:MAG: alpha/beta fold hydrolase [Gammaproteobacteria bacterium]